MPIHNVLSNYIFIAGFCAAFACAPAYAGDSPGSTAGQPPATVVFMCKYGSAKSLWAAERFNRMAELRGVNVRAISRVPNPGSFVHTRVSDVVTRAMALEGWQVADYKIDPVTPEEAAAATRVVHISVQGEPDPNSEVVAAAARVPEERWDDVPSMVRQYDVARSKLLPHVDALFEEIANKQGSLAAK